MQPSGYSAAFILTRTLVTIKLFSWSTIKDPCFFEKQNYTVMYHNIYIIYSCVNMYRIHVLYVSVDLLDSLKKIEYYYGYFQ